MCVCVCVCVCVCEQTKADWVVFYYEMSSEHVEIFKLSCDWKKKFIDNRDFKFSSFFFFLGSTQVSKTSPSPKNTSGSSTKLKLYF